jgi:hypothetical protein
MNVGDLMSLARARTLIILATVAMLTATPASAQVLSYSTGSWDHSTLGNHRVVVHVAESAGAIRVRIPWRRRDLHPERVETIVIDAARGERVRNVVRIGIGREAADFAFQPSTGPGDYYFYYLPHSSAGRSNYPTVEYPAPQATADSAWLGRHRLDASGVAGGAWRDLPEARALREEAIDELHSFFPMEVIATAAETEALRAAHPDAGYLLFPEDRRFPIRMARDLPYRWIECGPSAEFHGAAERGESYAFQIGLYAVKDVADVQVEIGDFNHAAGGTVIAASAVSAFNLGGVDSKGHDFAIPLSVARGTVQPLWFGIAVPERASPGRYRGEITVAAAGLERRTVSITLEVSDRLITAHGDDEPWRHSRLRWLDSRIALDDELVEPFTPVTVAGDRVSVLGRSVTLGADGMPSAIESYFAPAMTHLDDAPRDVLAGPVALVIEDADGRPLAVRHDPLRFPKRVPGVAVWETVGDGGVLEVRTHGEMEFDGNIEFTVAITARRAMTLSDIRLEIPIARDVATYMMGMGYKGGYRPQSYEWRWKVENNQDGAWIGDVNAGLQFSLRDERYQRPLNTNFYLSKPLIMPHSWANDGKGGCRLTEAGDAFLVRCYSGDRTMRQGETLRYDFRLALTPFKPIDTDAQWRTRFFHRYAPLDSIQALGANTVNVHHATPINPYINYPFLTPDTMKAYVDAAHERGMRVKIYYTVRELTNRAPELFALFSLGHEVLASGPGGGPSWLQEHLNGDYIAGWYVPRLEDAAVVNSGVSRWHNYYLEGLDWLARNIGIDGLYIDDVAFDRVTMKRVRKILDRNRPDALIDLHSANQFNVRDGFANSANLYLEHFPYIDRLWFGEYFDYDAPPDFWLVEVSGIPFGLMGEMLQDGGNPWRGMLYGMTNRLPWAGDPSPLWRAWDEFGIEGSRMIGYWVADAPVRTGRSDVLATTYAHDGRAMIALASWAAEAVSVQLEVDWAALGIDPTRATIVAPAIRDFQEARSFDSLAITVPPAKGWLLIVEERGSSR